MIFGLMLFTQTVRSVHVEEWTTFTHSFSLFRVIHCKTTCLVINSLTPLLSKSVWQSRSGSHSYHPTLQRRQQRQKGKEDGWGWAGGEPQWWWEFPLTGGTIATFAYIQIRRWIPCMGQTKTSQWEGCVPAAGREEAADIPAAPREGHREVVWEPRGPPSGPEWGEPLVARGELAFYLCLFSPVISAPATSATDV